MSALVPGFRNYLHEPVRDTAAITALLAEKRFEDGQLDFKSIPWKDNLETIKDVAALANHLGGDIIIGIDDSGDRANGLNPIQNAGVGAIRKQIHQWLINHIRAAEFAEVVEIVDVAVAKPDHSVIVVSIPPSPDLVAVEDRNSGNFLFPIRTGRRTRFLTYEEVMEKTSSATRATYLKLRRIAKVGTDLVRFSTPVVVRAGDFRVPLPIDDGSSGSVLGPNNWVIGRHGILHSLTPESITLQMSGSSRPIRAQRMRNGHLVEKNSIEVPKNHSLVIPCNLLILVSAC